MYAPSSAEEDKSLVTSAILAHPNDFEPSDLRPITFPSRLPRPVAQRTVFLPGSSWTSPSATAVLDALHTSYKAQTKAHEGLLRFARCAGAVAVDPALADLFDGPVTKGTGEQEGERLVQCKKCERPVLFTRFVAHQDSCRENKDEKSGDVKMEDALEGKDTPDEELKLICAPYGDTKPREDVRSPRGTRAKSRVPAKRSRVRAAAEKAAEVARGSSESKTFSFPPEEDDWEKALQPLAPEYKPRGAATRRRRVTLPAPTETPATRKRSLHAERKASAAAHAAGVFPLPRAGKDVQHEDPLRVTAARFGSAAPWARLMQIAMPVVVPRTPKRRNTSASQGGGSATAPGLQVTGIPPGASAAKPKPVDVAEKQAANVASSSPTLVGSLMYLRAQGMKELSNTALHQIDAPQIPTGRTGAVFHGQSYVAELGTFETDPRAPTTIKMPLTTAPQYPLAAKAAASAAAAANANAAADARAKKFLPKNQPVAVQHPTPTTTAPHQPVTKKQRTSKAQRTQMATPSAPMPNGPGPTKPVQPPRKSGSSRSSAGTTTNNVKGGTNSADSHQRPSSVRNAAQTGASNAVSAAKSAASAAAASKYATQQQLALQKKGAFRPMNAPGSVAMSARVGSGQSLPMGSATPSGVHVTGKGGGRGTKARVYPSPHQNNPAMAMRPAASNKITKTPSPSQASSRSGERLPMHRGSPMSAGPYDPLILASSQHNATTSGMNRVGGVRGVPGKAQLDFQQVMAQVAGQVAGRDMSTSGVSRGAIPHPSPNGQQLLGAGKLGGQMQRPNMRGMPPQARAKQNASSQNIQARMAAAAHKNSRQQARGQLRKDDLHQKSQDIEAQLRRADALPNEMVASKGGKLNDTVMFGKRPDRNNLVVNHTAHASQGFYSAALAAASAQLGSNAALKNQQNLLMHMARTNPNAVGAGAGAATGPNILQNMQDLRPLQNLGVVPGMQPAGHNANMLSFLQASGLSGGMAQTGAMNNLVAPGMPGGAMPPAPNPGIIPNEAILQHILAASRAPGMNQNAQLHGAPMGPPTAPVNHVHPHPAGRTGPMGQMPPPPVVQQSPNAAIDEIDRALGLSFDESDLMD